MGEAVELRPWTETVEDLTELCPEVERADAVAAVIPSQLRVVADLSGVTATGSQTVPAQVYLDGSSDMGVVGSYRVSVSVRRG